MAGCGSASTPLKIALFCSLAAFGIHVAGFATSYWILKEVKVKPFDSVSYLSKTTGAKKITQRVNYGLWQFCLARPEYSTCGSHPFETDDVKITRSLEIAGVVMGLFTLGLVLVRMCVAGLGERTAAKAFAIIASFLSGIIILAGTIAFVLWSTTAYLSWSFYLTVGGGVLYIITVMFLSCDQK